MIFIIPAIGESKVAISNTLQKPWQCKIEKNEWKCVDVHNENSNLYKDNFYLEKKFIIAKSLGWTPINKSNNLCYGHYYKFKIN